MFSPPNVFSPPDSFFDAYRPGHPKGAPDLAIARKWLDFIGKAEPQLKATDISGYMPLNETAVLPASLEKIVGMPLSALKPRLIQPDWAYIAEKQKERVAFVEKAIAGIK